MPPRPASTSSPGRRAPTGCCTIGPISGAGGTSYAVNYPGATSTSVYGPDLLANGDIRLVGSYRGTDGNVHGFVFQGTTADLSNASRLPDDRLSRRDVHLHPQHDGRPRGRQRAAISRSRPTTRSLYSISQDQILTDIVYPGSNVVHHGLRHLVQRRDELHDRRRLYHARQPRQDGRRGLPGRLRLVDRAIHQLDVVRRPGRTGRPVLRHPLPGHQQPRAGRLHAGCRHDRCRIEHGPSRRRWRPSGAIPTARSAPPTGST